MKMGVSTRRTMGLPLVFLFIGVKASVSNGPTSISITRHHKGDTFVAQDAKCYEDLCLGMSSGTAGPTDTTGCHCQCMPNLPVFRDDLHICVDDIQECSLSPFLSGTTSQKVPYVFLPLKGQIVYPSAEIIISDITSPICVVSGAQFLGRRGWVQLRNNSDTELPFRLFRDEGRTHLQWLGEGDLRLAMEGRLILVHLMCKDASGQHHKIFTPCIAFRVAGNPSAGIREMMFATDRSLTRESDRSLSVSEYIAIGVCILLLGLIYVASIFLYLYYRKKKKEKNKTGDGAHLTVAEEGIVKSNPLLQATRRHLVAVAGQDNGGYASDSGSCCSESDKCSDIILPDDDGGGNHQNMEISAMVHPCNFECNASESFLNQDSNNIEKLPEEDVSIVETLEGKEERPETVRTMGSANAPPPAALEFLTKIREVIAIAKHKMSAKRFSPSLIGIPEEDYYSRGGKGNSYGNRSRPASVLSFTGSTESKRNRKSACLACAENEVGDMETRYNLASTGSCCPTETKQRIIRKWLEDVPFVKSARQSEQEKGGNTTTNRAAGKDDCVDLSVVQGEGKAKTAESKGEESSSPEARAKSAGHEVRKPPAPPQRKEVKKSKAPAPPRPPPPPPVVPSQNADQEKVKNILNGSEKVERRKSLTSPPFKGSDEGNRVVKPPPPPMHTTVNKMNAPSNPGVNHQEEEDNIPRVQGKDCVPPVVAKTLMDAVIQEMIVHRKSDKNPTQIVGAQNLIKKSLKPTFDMVQVKNSRNEIFHNADKSIFEMDSLERKTERINGDKEDSTSKISEVDDNDVNGYNENLGNDRQPKENAKEIDSCIEIYTGEVSPTSKSGAADSIEEANNKQIQQDDHDYEVILLNPAEVLADPADEKEKELKIYNLPEILSKNDRSEGYSLVSEVYVNDGYSYSSDGSTQSNSSGCGKQGKSRSVTSEKPGRLTIHVRDSPENYKQVPDETETFEPDTLDRKPGKFRYSKTIGNWETSVHDQYSNQRFHEMDLECQHSNSNGNGNENFIDSLERPRISLKTSGSFRRNSLERDVNELFNNLNAPLARHFGSLREIYEAKSRRHRRRAETSSLVGSVTSDAECNSTLSWSEDRRNKLLHRGIILHVGDDSKKLRRHRGKSSTTKINYPDVVPPRPPKPSSLSGTPTQRSGLSTPGSLSHCPSPTSRSTCTSPPPRSNCTSPRPISIHFPPPPPPPRTTNVLPRRSTNCTPSHRSGRASPPLPPSRSICSSPTFYSGRSSPCKVVSSPQPPPRSLCSSPISQRGRMSPSGPLSYIPPPPRVTSGMKPSSQSPSRSVTSSPSRSPCTSPVPPPRPPSRSLNRSPPLPPRSSKPPLPPKNAKGTRQKKSGTDIPQGRQGSSLARRPLPPIPSPRHYQDSTLSSVSSRDLETLSTLSGASIDSLNSSDYEAFYTLPYNGSEGEIFDKAQRRSSDIHKTLKIFALSCGSTTGNTVFIASEDGGGARLSANVNNKVREDAKCARGKNTPDSIQSWRKAVERGEQTFRHKVDDSGYLSTDSESGQKHRRTTVETMNAERSENAGSQGSETEESLCDGASESGAESIATDSFFFGNFNKVKTAGSLDSGVGSEVNKGFVHSFNMGDNDANPVNEGRDVFISVRQ